MDTTKPDQIIDRAYAVMKALPERTPDMEAWMRAVDLAKKHIHMSSVAFIGRDNHTFLPLPEDPEAALKIVMDDFDNVMSFSNLYTGRFPRAMLPESRGLPHAERAAYEAESRAWLEAVARLTREYEERKESSSTAAPTEE
jgi:hypothetical protein